MVDFSFSNPMNLILLSAETLILFLARERFCDMNAQPLSVGRLAHLTDDEILDRFDRILLFQSLSHYSEQFHFRSRCSRLPRSGSRSNRNLYALVGFRLNLIAYLSGANKRKDKVFAWAHQMMQNRCDRDNMGEAGIDSFQEPVDKEFVPGIPSFPKIDSSLGWHKRFY